jgi:Bacterial Ig domain
LLGPISPSGQVTYTPAAGFSGPDSFSYTGSDAQGRSSVATITLNVAAQPPATRIRATLDDQRITLTTPTARFTVC